MPSKSPTSRKRSHRKSMRYTKLAITVPSAQAQAIRKAVAAGAAPSVSAYLTAAAAEKLEHESLDALVAEMKRDFGEPDADISAEVEAALEHQRRAREIAERRRG